MKIRCSIPFSGFYGSFHYSYFDDALEYDMEHYEVVADKKEKFIGALDWKAIYEGYSKAYADAFAGEFDFKSLDFKELVRPCPYSVATDCIVVEVELVELQAKFDTLDKVLWARVVKDGRTNSGDFINDAAQWGTDLNTFKPTQLSLVMDAIALAKYGDKLADFLHFDLLELERCNGFIEELMHGSGNNAYLKLLNECTGVKT